MTEHSAHSFLLADEAATLALGRRLGHAAVAPGLVVYLEGDLGAGKSTLARGWLAGMGHGGRVKSPTYTLLEPYSLPGGRELAHLDLYRLSDPEELEFLGLRELSDPGHWLLIEWPEKGAGHLPAADLEIRFGFPAGGGRQVEIRGCTSRGAAWLGDNVGALRE
ncbi:MAG TPA: tRNA (adenosine(37)-N6)-threonylcarbamoyltransferase complex ATPase subunit type 1 TsaE [Gammaproteobacteria bacterium]